MNIILVFVGVLLVATVASSVFNKVLVTRIARRKGLLNPEALGRKAFWFGGLILWRVVVAKGDPARTNPSGLVARGYVLGFRSDTPWKKTLILIYYGITLLFVLVAFAQHPPQPTLGVTYLCAALIPVAGGILRGRRFDGSHRRASTSRATESRARADGLPDSAIDPYAYVIAANRRDLGCSVYIGRDGQSEDIYVRRNEHILALGPPRAGKTTSLIVPGILSVPGPVVSTSTKDDVMLATLGSRRRIGRCWLFDPSGTTTVPNGVERLVWSPIDGCTTWDSALYLTHAMVAATRPAKGVTDDTHWTERAEALLAPLLYACARQHLSIADAARWVSQRNLDQALAILAEHDDSHPRDQLEGLERTDSREMSGIWSTAAGVLYAYRSEAATDAARRSQEDLAFDVTRFPLTRDTVYICAGGRYQRFLAPIIVGFIEELKHATYVASRDGWPYPWSVLFALDEMANIAPLDDLPAMLSEGSGQNVQLLGCLQDLSQARRIWGEHADGFLTLFRSKVVLAGVNDVRTLEAFSTIAGEWDEEFTTTTAGQTDGGSTFQHSSSSTYSESRSTRRVRKLPPDKIARPDGECAWYFGVDTFGLLRLTPCYDSRYIWKRIVETPLPEPLVDAWPGAGRP